MIELPVYSALIESEDDGIYCISLVDAPATEVGWQCFSKDEQDSLIQKYSIQNEEQHILNSVVMVADSKIYRRDESGYEYYIVYSKETIRLMAEKLMRDNTFNNIDIQHNEQLLPKGMVSLIELYIKDSEKGLSPVGFENVPDGSLMCSYKVHNDELWEMCKNGTLNGFSLAGIFSVKRQEFNKQKKNFSYKHMLKSIKEKLASLLMEFGEVSTDKGTIYFEGELAVGVEVQDAEGNPVADGEYVAEDKVIVVADGKVSEIKDKEVEEPETPETTEPTEPTEPETTVEAEEETPESEPETEHNDEPTEPQEAPETPEVENRVAELETKVGNLTALVEELKTKLETYLATPEVEPVSESFSKIVSDVKNPSRTHTAMRDALARVRESKK